ncbi:MAG: FAD-dependent oxidoreductase [Deltaproteobacteria bacterium]|nr:FAD-dependent oxidoreductase [Deltaproteobacteria bacterium]
MKFIRPTLAFLLSINMSVAVLAAAKTDYPITIVGGNEASFTPSVKSKKPIVDSAKYDVIIVGGGLAGLSSAVYLSDEKKKVLLLEKEADFGGLAAKGMTSDGIRFDRGAAYWTAPYEEELQIFKRIGLGNFEKHAIPEPIDSYLTIQKKSKAPDEHKLYRGIWDEGLHDLPISFSIFKYELLQANKDKLIPDQPFEEFANPELDKLTAVQWINQMPAKFKFRNDAEAQELQKRFADEIKSKKISKENPMKEVVEFLHLFCRSALGSTCNNVSALVFANFYISEISTRYSSDVGTAKAAENMVEILKDEERQPYVNLLTKAAVGKISKDKKSAKYTVSYLKDGAVHQAKAPYVVFAAQLKLAPKFIEGFNAQNKSAKVRKQVAAIQKLKYAHYSIHVATVKGHPYRDTYDTWVRASDYSENDFSDVILAYWMNPEIDAYKDFKDFKSHPKEPENSLITIYHPHPASAVKNGKGFTDADAKAMAKKAVARVVELFNPFLKKNWNTEFEILSVQTNRWPYSAHIANPGHFTKSAKLMRNPFGNIFFAHNNMGTPALEEALFRGHCAAINVLHRMDPSFTRETWSKCPMEN